MPKVFRPSNRESKILSQIESSRGRERRMAISGIQECIDPLSNSIAMKLVEEKLVETVNKDGLEEQIKHCLQKLSRANDFDIDYQIAPVRNIASNPNIVSLYITAFIIETVINHKDVVDIFGSDEEIYACINKQILKYLPH